MYHGHCIALHQPQACPGWEAIHALLISLPLHPCDCPAAVSCASLCLGPDHTRHARPPTIFDSVQLTILQSATGSGGGSGGQVTAAYPCVVAEVLEATVLKVDARLLHQRLDLIRNRLWRCCWESAASADSGNEFSLGSLCESGSLSVLEMSHPPRKRMLVLLRCCQQSRCKICASGFPCEQAMLIKGSSRV